MAAARLASILMRRFTSVCLLLLAITSTARALEPSEILMVVNGNAPVSRKLAEFYAEKRHVPVANLVELDLPSREDINRDEYRKKIALPVRLFLEKHDPDHKIKCLLTFTGVPIRVNDRTSTPEEKDELAKIKKEQSIIEPQIAPLVQDLELVVKKLDPAYKPPTDLKVLQALAIRAERAVAHLLQRLNSEPDAELRRAALERMFTDLEPLTGPSGRLQRIMFRDLPVAVATQPTTEPAATEPMNPEHANLPADRRAQIVALQERIKKTSAAAMELASKQDNPAARWQLRELTRDELGLIAYSRILTNQEELLTTSETGAAVDNELALVLWGDEYPLYRWIENPLYFRNARKMAGAPRVLMVMRLDGPQDGTAQQIITTSLAAEAVGLGGRVVIDSQGIDEKNPDGSVQSYGEYDETLRRLAKLLKEKTGLPIVFDDQKPVLRAGSVKDVGVYVGWYAVRNYIPSCVFRPGAVGFHVASLEMISLKAAGERGWVAGLLNDGISATLGAVAEPYLHSFPKADEFFPLLLTGKLTLAEVYWRTNPLVSWQISMIGDPLYTPFKVRPAIKEEDLPEDLQTALRPTVAIPQASHPTTIPGRPVEGQ
jgi:uncharacterized protein (TIGR03790 family)